jgi:hypothetical protein
MNKSIEEMRAELRVAEQELKQREADERQAKMDATQIIMRFTIEPTTRRSFQEMYDDSCLLYRLNGEITNLDEAKAAGHSDHNLRAGGMDYIFNKLSGRIVTGVGGGTIWVGGGWGDKNADSARFTMIQISAFIVEHPEGGDITDIVEQHRKLTIG